MRTAKTISFLIIFSISGLFVNSLSAARPLISIEETSYDFVSAKKGEVIRHTFTFVNKGDEVLKIIEFFLT